MGEVVVKNGFVAHDPTKSLFWKEGEAIPPAFLDFVMETQAYKMEEIKDGEDERVNTSNRQEQEETKEDEQENEKKVVETSPFESPLNRMMEMVKRGRGRPRKVI